MTINDNTLSNDVFTAIRTIIVAAAPKVTTSSGTKTASVLAAYNDKTNSVPQVIIYPVSYSEDNWKFSSSQGKKMINVLVECYYKTSLGVDQLQDIVTHAIKTTDISGMELVGVIVDTAFVNPNDQKYHMKGITFVFDRE